VGIETPGEGVVHPIVYGMCAVLEAEQLEDLKRHTRRGMRGRIQAGLSAGGLTYGYAPGQDRASSCSWSTRPRSCGASSRNTPMAAHREQSPRASTPTTSALPAGGAGRPRRSMATACARSGILMNALYDGRLVWNRVSMRKDPEHRPAGVAP
jgi:site-specific DNA recombinase